MNLLVHVVVTYDLRDAVAVAQVNEDNAAQIAPAVHPAHQQRARARIFGAQLATCMSAA